MYVSVASAAAALLVSAVMPYPVVAHLGGTPVRAPIEHDTWGNCPAHTFVLDAGGLGAAKRALLLALPTIAMQASPPLKLGGARVINVTHTRRDGFILPSRRSCRGTSFLRSALVQIVLPAERAAPDLRGNPWFYVARTRDGWIVWDEAH